MTFFCSNELEEAHEKWLEIHFNLVLITLQLIMSGRKASKKKLVLPSKYLLRAN